MSSKGTEVNKNRLERLWVSTSFVLSLLLLSCLTVKAQHSSASIKTYHAHSYYEEDGLASNMVYEMAQAADGLMWFATQKGISTFDGLRWNTFDSLDYHFPSASKVHLAPTFGGGMLLSTVGIQKVQFFHYENNLWNKITVPDSVYKSTELYFTRTEVFEYLPGRYYLAFNLGGQLHIFNSEAGHWEEHSIPGIIDPEGLYDLHFFKNQLYFLTGNGVHKFDLRKKEFEINTFPELNNQMVLDACHSASGDEMYLLGSNFLGRVKNGKYATLVSSVYDNQPNHLHYYNITADKGDRIFFNHNAALFKYSTRSGRLEPIIVDHEKPDAIPTDIIEDKEGNVWFSTLRGISKINSFRFHTINKNSGLIANEVSTIELIDSSTVLLGGNHGFSLHRPDTIINYPLPVDHFNSSFYRVLDAVTVPDGNTYLATNSRGTGHLKPNRELEWYLPPPDQLINTLTYYNDSLFAASHKGNLYYLKEGSYIPVLNLKNVYIRKLLSRPDSLLLLTNRGIFIKSDGGIKQIFHKEKHFSNIYSYLRWNGRTFIGSIGGLLELKGDSLMEVKEAGLRIDRPVYALLEDVQGRLWAGTDKGVYVYQQGSFVNYNLHHGLAGKEINRNAFQLMPDGKIWIGTDQGVSVYNSMDDMEKYTLPSIRLTSFLVPNKEPLSPLKALELPHHQNTLEVSFQAISFSNPTDLRFRYRLEGLEEKWVYSENHLLNQVRYPDLSPGEYRFVVQAGLGNNQWSKAAESATIKVLSPFYATGWFLLIALATISSAGYIAHALLTHRKNEQTLKEAIEQKKTEVEKSEKRFRAVWNATDTGIALVDKEGKVLMANPSLCTFLGTDAGTASGKPIFDLMPSPLLKKENLQKLYREKSVCRKDISISLHKQTHYLLVTISFIDHLIQGESLMIIGCKDITSQRLAETKNIRLNEKLLQQNTSLIKKEEELANYNHELLQQREELEQALRAVEERNYELDQFVYKTSHDLRAPIASAMGLLNLIEMESDQKRLPEYLKLIGNALEKQDGFIKAMLNFSRSTRSKNKAEGIDFREIIDQVLKDLQHLDGFEEIDKQLTVETDRSTFHSDSTKLYVVLANIISNSIKYRDPFKKSYIRIAVNVNQSGAEVVVQDNGIGIAKEHISQVFDMFYRATDRSDGSGLGLYIVKQTISKLRGHINISADRGEGTTVCLFVPCQQVMSNDDDRTISPEMSTETRIKSA